MQSLFVRCIATALVGTLCGCSSESDLLRKEILKAAAASRENKVSLDLQPFSEARIKKICLQTPYLPKARFESQAKEAVAKFEEVGDEHFVLWVFYESQVATQVKFQRSHVNYKLPQEATRCSDTTYVEVHKSQLSIS